MSVNSPVIDYLDLATKHIYLLPGCREYHPVEDIYVEIRNLRRTNEALRVFDMPVKAFGSVPKGGGKFTPRYAVFYSDWKVVPEDTTHDLYISGEQITDGGESGKACLDLTVLSPGTNIFVHYEPPAAEIIRDEESLSAIAHMAFFNKVTWDSLHGSTDQSSADFGTQANPVKLLSDARTLALAEGFDIIRVNHDSVLDAGDFSGGFTFQGRSPITVSLQILAPVDVSNCQIETAYVYGILDGGTIFRECVIGSVAYVSGFIYNCAILGPVAMGGGTLSMPHCRLAPQAVVGAGYAEIDFEGVSGGNIIITGWGGGTLRVMNMVAGCVFGMGGPAGSFIIDASCTGGAVNHGGAIRIKAMEGVVDSINDATTAAQAANALLDTVIPRVP